MTNVDVKLYEVIQQLIRLREHKGLSQYAVAKRMGSTQSCISGLETGAVTPSLRTFLRYLNAVDADMALVTSWMPQAANLVTSQGEA